MTRPAPPGRVVENRCLPKAGRPPQGRIGRWVRLIPLTPEHYGFVRELVVNDPSGFHALFPARVPEQEAFADRLLSLVASCFVVESVNRRRPVGVAYLHQWSGQHGIADFQVTMVPSFRNTGVGVEAGHLFVDHVFRSFNIRKLYLPVTSCQRRTVRSAIGGVLQEEGRLRDHSYFAGRWHDQHILTITRDRYEECTAGVRPFRRPCQPPGETPADAPRTPEPSVGQSSTRWRSLEMKTRNLDSPRVRLVAAGKDHARYLYGLATSDEVGHRWRFGGAVPTFPEFQRTFDRGVFAQFVPVLRHNGQPFGHLVAYQADPANGHVHVGGVTEERLHRTGYPMDAFVIFMRYLFTNWNFRKIYMELPEFNRPQILSAGMIEGLKEEARLRDVIYYDGSWWDRSILSINRTYFTASLGCD